MFYAMKYFTLSTFAVFNNMAPFVTLLLAALILKESVTCFDYSNVLLGLSAICLITYGMTQGAAVSAADAKDPEKMAMVDQFSFFPFLAMIATPIMFGL